MIDVAEKRENDTVAARDGGTQVEGLFDLICFVELIKNMDADFLDLVEEDIVEVAWSMSTHVGRMQILGSVSTSGDCGSTLSFMRTRPRKTYLLGDRGVEVVSIRDQTPSLPFQRIYVARCDANAFDDGMVQMLPVADDSPARWCGVERKRFKLWRSWRETNLS